MKREPSLIPSSYQCGYQPRWGVYNMSPADGPVSYDRMLFSRQDEVWGLTNGLDIDTGIFTSQYRGVYEISWSLIGRDEDTHVSSGISLYKNHVKLQATGTSSSPLNTIFFVGYSIYVATLVLVTLFVHIPLCQSSQSRLRSKIPSSLPPCNPPSERPCSRDLGVLPRHVLLRDEWYSTGDRGKADVPGAGGGGHCPPPL